MIKRCPWVPLENLLYVQYHDEEWGLGVYDDKKLFEFLVLESAQAGLCFETILRKREGYRKRFANFDYNTIAKFTMCDMEKLVKLESAEIVRNRAKIEAVVNNACRFIEIRREFGSFSNYLWRFVDNKPIVNNIRVLQDYKTSTHISDALAKDMKKRGFKFLGSKTLYAYMQATGLVNDHTMGCFRKKEIIGLLRV
jgi:DNA-3-methyladenine glycosylase I